ncbi:MAG: hypothetical protein HC907_14935 [Richelia sp. SM1_7_0]|nr:hypothetical protein [Richelia sp. SM1_7_0]
MITTWLSNLDYARFKSVVGLHSLKISDAVTEAIENWIKKQIEENADDLESLFQKSENIPELSNITQKEEVHR